MAHITDEDANSLAIPSISSVWVNDIGTKYEVISVSNILYVTPEFEPTVTAVSYGEGSAVWSMPLKKWHELMQMLPLEEYSKSNSVFFDFDALEDDVNSSIDRFMTAVRSYYTANRRADIDNMCDLSIDRLNKLYVTASIIATANSNMPDDEVKRISQKKLALPSEINDLKRFFRAMKLSQDVKG